MIYTYKDLKKHIFVDDGSIPKIIFRTSHYKSSNLPKPIIDLYEEQLVLNDSYKLFYFDDNDCRELIEDTKDQDLIDAYDMLNAGAYKADLVRNLLLYKYGGVYMDFSMFCIEKLDNIINNKKLVLVKDLNSSFSGIYNAFMCSIKGNALFINTINESVKNINKRVYFDNVWELTGPVALKKEYCKINHVQSIEIIDDDNSKIYQLVEIENVKNNVHNIIDEKGITLIQTRLHNHYDILYKNKISYPSLFMEKKIYKPSFMGYDKFKKFNHNFNQNEVPKIIYRTGSFKFDELPKEIIELYESTLQNNQEYKMFYFDDDDRYNFIKDNYDSTYVEAYNKLLPKAYQADCFRYLIVYKYGGVYMDFSMNPIIPLKEIISKYKQVYVRDRLEMPIIYNAFIASIKSSKILELCIKKCLNNIKNKDYGYHSLCVTSPIILGEAISKIGIDGIFIDNKIQVGKINDEIFIYSFENGDGEYFKNPENGEFVVKNKIDNHYEIIYKNNYDLLRYNGLWENKMVFKDEIFEKIEYQYNKNYKSKISLLSLINIYKKVKENKDLDESVQRLLEINKIYEDYLEREADEGGLNNYFISNLGIDQIKNIIISSQEYHDLKKNAKHLYI